jgi:hypothetical protein
VVTRGRDVGVVTDAIADDYEVAVRSFNAHVAASRAGPGALRPLGSGELDLVVADRKVALADWIDDLDVAAYLRDEAEVPAPAIEAASRLLRLD